MLLLLCCRYCWASPDPPPRCQSKFVNGLGHDPFVLLRELAPLERLEVEAALVFLGVAVSPAIHEPAPALDPGESHLLRALPAPRPVGLHLGLFRLRTERRGGGAGGGG